MKILHLTHTDLLLDSRILKEINSLYLVDGFEIKGFGVSSKDCSSNFMEDYTPNLINFKLFSSNLKFIYRPFYYTIRIFELFILFFFNGLRFRPKVIHCHDTMVLPIGILFKFFLGSIIIYDAHELESRKNGQTKILSKFTFLIEKISWKYLDLFITVSPSIVQWYEAKLGPKKNLIVLNAPQFSSNKSHQKSSEYFRLRFNIPNNKKIYLYLGIIGKGRGIEMYLKIFESIDIDAHVVFMGFGDLVGQVTERSKYCKKIHYHPRVPHEEIVAISSSADYGLLIIENVSLSDFYCLPNKLFEYAFSGLPVIASNFPDMMKVIEDYELGICCSVSIEEVSKIIEKLENENVVRVSNDLYPLSWQFQAEKLVLAYKEIFKNLKLSQKK
jgi:glycosyltransferase involved in cell wall biosynthesis